MRSLQFFATDINDKRLSFMLLRKFPMLRILRLTRCNFRHGNNNGDAQDDGAVSGKNEMFKMIVPETSIDLLHIDRCDIIRQSMLLICVFSTEQNIKRHYINVNAKDRSTALISRAAFTEFSNKLKPEDVGIISVHVESIRMLRISGPIAENEIYRQIVLKFP